MKKKKDKTLSSLKEKYKKDLERARQLHLTKIQKKRESPTLQKRQEELRRNYKSDRKTARKKVINGVYKKLKSKRITYKKSNPLKSLLKTSGKVPNVQVKQGENVNLWK